MGDLYFLNIVMDSYLIFTLFHVVIDCILCLWLCFNSALIDSGELREGGDYLFT